MKQEIEESFPPGYLVIPVSNFGYRLPKWCYISAMATGRAKLAMGQGLSTWVLEAPNGFGEAGFHSHHAIQISICLAGELMLATQSSIVRGNCIAVASDARHRLEGHGVIAFIFVEPESTRGRALSEALFRDTDILLLERDDLHGLGGLKNAFDGSMAPAQLLELSLSGIECLASGLPAARQPDQRIRRIIDYAASNLESSLAVAAAGSGVHLSLSRLRHLFVEQTGLAFRTYLLWLRLNRALQVYALGRSLTEAAHAAGFADSAHFSRVFKRTFGLPATTLERV